MKIRDNSAKALPGLRLVGMLQCAFADLCKKMIFFILVFDSSAYIP